MAKALCVIPLLLLGPSTLANAIYVYCVMVAFRAHPGRAMHAKNHAYRGCHVSTIYVNKIRSSVAGTDEMENGMQVVAYIGEIRIRLSISFGQLTSTHSSHELCRRNVYLLRQCHIHHEEHVVENS